MAITNYRKGVLYVNHTVPQRDIEGFLKVIMFPGYAVADEESETGAFLDYVHEKYGFGAYRVLMDSHKWYMEQKEKARAKEAAKAIIPLIEKEVDSENPIVEYGERLIHEVYCAGLDRKEETPRNISRFSSIYVFYLGYLMGAGMLNDGVIP